MKDKVHVPGEKDRRRYETQKNQREARKAGTLSPRGLARSVAKAYARKHGMKASDVVSDFRKPGFIQYGPGKKTLYR